MDTDSNPELFAEILFLWDGYSYVYDNRVAIDSSEKSAEDYPEDLR